VTVTLPDGRELESQTTDIGADGLTLERLDGLPVGASVSVSVALPWEPDEVYAQALVTAVDDTVSLVLVGAQHHTRRRLMDFVTEQLRRRLAIVRSLQEERSDDWD
jgi:hypothetical protein